MKFALYMLRWQLSTPILWLATRWLADSSALASAVVANLVGGLLFFWVDREIFGGSQ